MPREPIRAPLGVNVPGFAMAGFQVTLHGRIWVTAEVDGKGERREVQNHYEKISVQWV